MKYLSLLLTVSLLLTSCGVEKTENGKTPYDVDVIKVAELGREVMLTKSALMKAGTQVTLNAQASGRV